MEVGNKKLLVVNCKGFLIDPYHENDGNKRPKRRPDGKVNRFYVYTRPGWREFVQFCLDNFVVGIWSSAYRHNVTGLTNFIYGESAKKLAFVWSVDQCTESGLQHPTKRLGLPLVWKELSKVWSTEYGLPWKKGAFGPSNTLMVDDDRSSCEKNPPNTVIILKTFRITDPDDGSLGQLRKYLERLAGAPDVQEYVEKFPFGELRDSVTVPDDDLSLELLKSLSIKDKRETDGAASVSSSDPRNPRVDATVLAKKEAGLKSKSAEHSGNDSDPPVAKDIKEETELKRKEPKVPIAKASSS